MYIVTVSASRGRVSARGDPVTQPPQGTAAEAAKKEVEEKVGEDYLDQD
jgi:hypothetical protein